MGFSPLNRTHRRKGLQPRAFHSCKQETKALSSSILLTTTGWPIHRAALGAMSGEPQPFNPQALAFLAAILAGDLLLQSRLPILKAQSLWETTRLTASLILKEQ